MLAKKKILNTALLIQLSHCSMGPLISDRARITGVPVPYAGPPMAWRLRQRPPLSSASRTAASSYPQTLQTNFIVLIFNNIPRFSVNFLIFIYKHM